MPPSNLEVVGSCLEAAARGDLDAVRALLHPAVRWHGAGDETGGCHGRDEALTFMRNAFAEGASVRAEWLVEAGELVVAVMGPARPGADRDEAGYETGTHGTVARLVDGRIAEITVYPSADEALAARRRRAGSSSAAARGASGARTRRQRRPARGSRPRSR